MANRWTDSCTAYASVADMFVGSYVVGTGNPSSIQTAGGRWGNGSIRLASSTGFKKVFGTGLDEWVVGYVVMFTTGPVGVAHFGLYEGTTQHVRISTSANKFIVQNGAGTTLGTSNTTIALGVPYAVQLKSKIHDTTGTVELWIDDNLQFSLTGQDTRNGGTTGLVDTFWWGWSSSSNTTDISEIYINDTTGSAPNNGIWGSYRIDARVPNAAGNYAQWTPLASTNLSNVDELRNDGDTSYNSSATANQKDSFQFSAIPSSSGSVPAIMHRIVARKDDAGTRTIRPIQRQSSTDYAGTSQNLTTTHAHYTEVVETNPATSAAYTVAEMTGTSPEFGYELVA